MAKKERKNRERDENQEPSSANQNSDATPQPPPQRKTIGPRYLNTDDQQVICKLPQEHFGPNSWLFAKINSEAKGLKHIIIRHKNDFGNENRLVQDLKSIISSESYVGVDNDNQFVWSFVNARGEDRELVTALEPQRNHFELITAWKQRPKVQAAHGEGSMASLLTSATAQLANLFGCCLGLCPPVEEEEEEYEEEPRQRRR